MLAFPHKKHAIYGDIAFFTIKLKKLSLAAKITTVDTKVSSIEDTKICVVSAFSKRTFLYYIVDSKILKIHRKIFSISSLVKISIT